MIVLIVVVAWLAALGVKASQRLGRWHPSSLFVWGWVVTLVGVGLKPLGAESVLPEVLFLILVGMVAFVAAAIIVDRRRSTELVVPQTVGPHPVGVRFIATATLVLLLVVVGHLQYKTFVSGVLGVDNLASVDRGAIRRATTSGDAQHGGLGALLLNLTPLLGCIGVEGYVRTRRAAWLVLVPLAIYLISIDPGRAGVLGTITTSVVYMAYRSRATISGRARRTTRRRTAGFALVAAVFGLVFFVQQSLSIDTQAVAKAPGYAPPSMVEPLLYWTGGVNAFSVALQDRVNPFERRGRTVSVAFRAAQIVDPDVTQPSSLASYANMPLPTNVYTAFGDAWFDFGLPGVILLMGGLGAMTSSFHWRARSLGPKWAWLAALLASSLVNTLLSFTVFTVAVLFPAALGWVLLRETKVSSVATGPQQLVDAFDEAT